MNVTFLILSLPLFALGLFVRLALGFLWGSQDIEFWKSYGDYFYKNGMLGIYGAPDRESWKLIREGVPIEDRVARTRTWIPYAAMHYPRTEFWLPHLPLFLYPILGVTALYKKINPYIPNNRLFNFFINLVPLIANAILTGLIYFTVSQTLGINAGLLASLLYWLSPLVILNAPVLGFMDAPTALLSTAALYFLTAGHLTLCYVALACAIAHKAQGVFVAPIIFAVGFSRYSVTDNLIGWAVAAVAMLIIIGPFVIAGRVIIMFELFLLQVKQAQYINAQVFNPWFVFQYKLNVEKAIEQGFDPAFARAGGRDTNWFGHLFVKNVKIFGKFSAARFGEIAFLTFTAVLVWKSTLIPLDRSWLIYFAGGLEIYGYCMLRTGVQVNHYFCLVPLFTIAAVYSPVCAIVFAGSTFCFILQDLLFYGIGRDYNPAITILSELKLGWLGIPMSWLNFAVFLLGFIWFLFAF